MPPRRTPRTPPLRDEPSHTDRRTPDGRDDERLEIQLEANRLMQETLNVLLAERQQAPDNPPRPTKSAFEKFDASRPPTYDGTVDPKVMLEWVDKVESLFTVHETPEQKKVEIATFYLRKEASKWWRQVRTACSWEEFK